MALLQKNCDDHHLAGNTEFGHHYDIDTSRGFATDQVLPLAAFLISLSLDDVARQDDPL